MLPFPSSIEHLTTVDGSVERKLQKGQLLGYLLRFVGEEIQLGGRCQLVTVSSLSVGLTQHEFKVRELEEGRERGGDGYHHRGEG